MWPQTVARSPMCRPASVVVNVDAAHAASAQSTMLKDVTRSIRMSNLVEVGINLTTLCNHMSENCGGGFSPAVTSSSAWPGGTLGRILLFTPLGGYYVQAHLAPCS